MFPSSILGAAADILKLYKFLENFNDNKVLSFSHATFVSRRLHSSQTKVLWKRQNKSTVHVFGFDEETK